MKKHLIRKMIIKQVEDLINNLNYLFRKFYKKRKINFLIKKMKTNRFFNYLLEGEYKGVKSDRGYYCI